jgi:hypothetical protein
MQPMQIFVSSSGKDRHRLKALRRILQAQSDGGLGDPIGPYDEWANELNEWLCRLGVEDIERLQQENRRLRSELALQSQGSDAADSAPLRTGAPGRPSSMNLVLDEDQRRRSSGVTQASTQLEEAESLAQWLRDTHPLHPTLTAKKIRPQHRNAKKPRN